MKLYVYFLTIILSVLLLSCGTENKPTYKLTTTVSPSEGGTISPSSGDFSEDEVVELTGTPTSEGWRFIRWEGDLSTSSNPVNIGMNRNYNIIGIFEKRDYPLNITIEGNGTIQEKVVQQKSTDYPFETIVELTPVPDNGWKFIEWGGDLSGSDAPKQITITNEKNVTATFVQQRDTQTEVVEVTSATGRVWMDRNLGASRAATSSTDSQAYGDLYQWGRAADGHQNRNSPTTSTLSSSDQPGHGEFILAPDDPRDWRSPQNNNLWQGLNGVNNPCPDGYRLPTEAEWEAERNSWSSNNASGAFNSPLKLPMAGDRTVGGSILAVGFGGYYWSGTVSGSGARDLYFDISNAFMDSYGRAGGDSVRCIKDTSD